jgi:hypothetical protein
MADIIHRENVPHEIPGYQDLTVNNSHSMGSGADEVL